MLLFLSESCARHACRHAERKASTLHVVVHYTAVRSLKSVPSYGRDGLVRIYMQKVEQCHGLHAEHEASAGRLETSDSTCTLQLSDRFSSRDCGKKPSGKPSLCEEWNAHRLDSSCRTDQIPDSKNLRASPLSSHISTSLIQRERFERAPDDTRYIYPSSEQLFVKLSISTLCTA
jgi:hypothetical protein